MKTTDEFLNTLKNGKAGAKTSDNVLEFPKAIYKPFGAPHQTPQMRFAIKGAKELKEVNGKLKKLKGLNIMPAYSYLYNVVFDEAYEFIGLEFPDMKVKIYGRNLGEMIISLQDHTLEFMDVFHPKIHEIEEETDPFIEEILIINPPFDPIQEIIDAGRDNMHLGGLENGQDDDTAALAGQEIEG